MDIYFDNAATAPVCEAAMQAVQQAMGEVYGNPSSLHGKGLEAERLVKQSRERVALALGVNGEVYFTSGGTESNNSIIFGVAYAKIRRGKRIITSTAEHPSVLACFEQLKDEGFDVAYVGVNEQGYVKLDELRNLLNASTTLVSIQHINSETGAIQPLKEISALVRELSPEAAFHADCVQSFCKHPLNIKEIGLDAISVSAHKVGGLKGCGAIWRRRGLNLKPLIYGGGQQNDVRPGTENVPGIAAFGAAVTGRNINENLVHVQAVKDVLLTIPQRYDDVILNGDANGSPFIANMSFLGIRSETLLHALEERGIYVSAGSACSSKSKASKVLLSMGLGQKRAESAIRFSLSADNTIEEAEAVLTALDELVPMLRRFNGVRR